MCCKYSCLVSMCVWGGNAKHVGMCPKQGRGDRPLIDAVAIEREDVELVWRGVEKGLGRGMEFSQTVVFFTFAIFQELRLMLAAVVVRLIGFDRKGEKGEIRKRKKSSKFILRVEGVGNVHSVRRGIFLSSSHQFVIPLFSIILVTSSRHPSTELSICPKRSFKPQFSSLSTLTTFHASDARIPWQLPQLGPNGLRRVDAKPGFLRAPEKGDEVDDGSLGGER